MSTLNGPFWSRYGIALTYPSRSHFQRTLNRKNGARVGMSVAAHQEKEKNEERKTGKRNAGEKRRPATDFEEVACCPSGVVQGGSTAKKWIVRGWARSNWDSRKGQQPFLSNPNGVGNRTTRLRWLLIGAEET